MPPFIKQKAIVLNPPQKYGHVVYPRARVMHKKGSLAIVFKENKEGKPLLSNFEVAFSQLARLCLDSNLTPPQRLVKNDNMQVVGVGCEHISYTIARREILPNNFYQLKKPEHYAVSLVDVKNTEDIPYYFLDGFKSDLFPHLIQEAREDRLALDMHSLVSILTSSYFLEEDDLHKGNFGFYIVQKDAKPHVVFFKIDHDLMLADSIMSHCSIRFNHWINDESAFKITARDLIDFPNLKDSGNYYWPTIKHFIPWSSKAYTSNEETKAFANLAASEEFQRLKWWSFYKHILISPQIIRQSLSQQLNENDPSDRAQIALIIQSVMVRQANLRAVLFSIPEFRSFICTLTADDRQQMIHNIVYRPDEETEEVRSLTECMRQHQSLCGPEGGFVEGDTPLHAAIRLKDYRYHETWKAYGTCFSNSENSAGKTPLDVALDMSCALQTIPQDIREDALNTAKHLLKEGAHETPTYNRLIAATGLDIKNYTFTSDYVSQVLHTENFKQLKQILRNLGEDYRYSLKMKKEISVLCVRQFIHVHHNNPLLASMLQQLKLDLNGSKNIPPAVELQFIRQWRSSLWIVRIIRGLFGGTSTQVELTDLIDKELKCLSSPPSSKPSSGTFFSEKYPSAPHSLELKTQGSMDEPETPALR